MMRCKRSAPTYFLNFHSGQRTQLTQQRNKQCRRSSKKYVLVLDISLTKSSASAVESCTVIILVNQWKCMMAAMSFEIYKRATPFGYIYEGSRALDNLWLLQCFWSKNATKQTHTTIQGNINLILECKAEIWDTMFFQRKHQKTLMLGCKWVFQKSYAQSRIISFW